MIFKMILDYFYDIWYMILEYDSNMAKLWKNIIDLVKAMLVEVLRYQVSHVDKNN